MIHILAQTGQNFTLLVGGTKELAVEILDNDGVVMTSANIVAASWQLTDKNKTVTYLEKTLGSGIAFNAEDQCVVTLTDTDTLGLTGGLYYHELAVEDVDGNKDVIYSGNVTVKKSPALWDIS